MKPNRIRCIFLCICVVTLIAIVISDHLSKTTYTEVICVGIRSATENLSQEEISEDGIGFTWHVSNNGTVPMTFAKNAIAQIIVNAEKYDYEVDAKTLSPGESYDIEIRIPPSILRSKEANTIIMTASSEKGASGTIVYTFNQPQK